MKEIVLIWWVFTFHLQQDLKLIEKLTNSSVKKGWNINCAIAYDYLLFNRRLLCSKLSILKLIKKNIKTRSLPEIRELPSNIPYNIHIHLIYGRKAQEEYNNSKIYLLHD